MKEHFQSLIIQFQEKGGHKKYGNKVESPRYLIKENLELYDNFFDKNELGGDSGYALEVILLGNKYYFKTLLKCRNLKALSNTKLFTQEDSSELLIEIKKIFKLNRKKKDNGYSVGFEGSKHVDLKRLEIDFVNNIKEEIGKYLKLK
jgi:hypothetical protein